MTTYIKTIKAVYKTTRRKTYKADMPKKVYNHFKYLAKELQEHFTILYVSNSLDVYAETIAAIGAGNYAAISPADVIRPAILLGCRGMILIHNHPSGTPGPSIEDYEITDRMCKAAKLLSLEVFDHIIIYDGGYYSMADNGDLVAGSVARRV